MAFFITKSIFTWLLNAFYSFNLFFIKNLFFNISLSILGMIDRKNNEKSQMCKNKISKKKYWKLHEIYPENDSFCALGEIASILSRILGEI